MKKITVHGRTYDIVTLDFETYYETGVKGAYSLRNKDMNMSEYIRDERFLAHCVGIKKGSSATKIYHYEVIKRALEAIDWSRTVLVCHNTYFDGFILSHHYGVVPAFYADTMCMSRILHGATVPAALDFVCKMYGLAGKTKAQALVNAANKRELTKAEQKAQAEYCKDDVDGTYALFCKQFTHMSESEMRLINMTVRMFCDPVLELDENLIAKVYDDEVNKKLAAMEAVSHMCDKKELVSNDKFAVLLNQVGYPPPMKISKTTNEPTYAFAKTDLEFIDMMENGPEIVQALCNARLKNKTSMEETRALRLMRAGSGGQKLPVMLNYCGAHTMRWSGGNKLNFQNFKRGGDMRKSILAPKGSQICVVDSAQIEARVLAWLSGESWLVQAFANGDDVYSLFASGVVYNIPFEDVSKEQRFVGKVCILGLGYGMSGRVLNDTLAKGAMGPPVKLSQEETQRIVAAYRKKNSKIVALWSRAEQILIDMIVGREGQLGPLHWGKGYMGFPNGHFMYYRGLSGEIYTDRYGKTRLTDAFYLGRKDSKTYIYGGSAVENWVQCLARIIVGEQMLEIDEKYRVVMTTHDECGSLVPAAKRKAEAALKFMLDCMTTAPDWAEGLPLGAEGGYDVCYSK